MTTPTYLASLEALAILGLPLVEMRADHDLPPNLSVALSELEIALLKVRIAVMKGRISPSTDSPYRQSGLDSPT